jgi:hypothetical protein
LKQLVAARSSYRVTADRSRAILARELVDFEARLAGGLFVAP